MAWKLKVMLVEDELLVRLGIKSLVDWESHSFDYIGDAADGEMALELMEQGVPDILLTDIVMPRMDGLELIARVKEKYPDMMIIVLSSHDEYDYVRRAMKLGIEDYVLKTSIKPSVLLELLGEAAAKYESRRGSGASPAPAERRESQADRMGRQLRGELQEPRPAGLELPPLPKGMRLLHLRVRGFRDESQRDSAFRLLDHLVQSELRDFLGSSLCMPNPLEMAALIQPLESTADAIAADAIAAEAAAARIDSLIRASGSMLGMELEAGLSPPCADWEELRGYYAEARRHAEESPPNAASREDIRGLLAYLGENYAKSLSLKDAAARLSMSEAYLSTLFKRETGMNFTDWVNRLRIEKASEYLKKTDMPSYLISERVGYENINYFGRIFKKVKGISPQQFRGKFKKGLK
ncbi:response regulator transcription factor [Paenibacillus humicus]|uniref:response regulator transcription factor n=1 Tax=Paenibacillus humicus TaxID=412861 RepID=UPI003F149B81